MKFTLEKHRAFPYVAWLTVIGFAVFTYTLVINLQDDLNRLNEEVAETSNSLEQMRSDRQGNS